MITNKLDYTRHYQKFHNETLEHIQNMKFFYQKMLLKFLPLDKNIHILDVGCGMGFTILALQDIGYKNVEGIDIDAGQVQSCINKNLKATKVDNSTEYLNHQSDKYDLIISLDVIEHLPHQEQLNFVRAIQTALKTEGKLICTVPNANSILASRWRYIDWTHYTSFTEHSLDFLLFNAGFEDIRIDETEFFHRPGIKGLLKLKILTHWLLFLSVRALRRLEMIAELGWEQGMNIPLSLNLLATAVKPL